MNTLQFLALHLMAVGVYTLVMWVVRIILALTGDRTGNSGRYKPWDQEDD